MIAIAGGIILAVLILSFLDEILSAVAVIVVVLLVAAVLIGGMLWLTGKPAQKPSTEQVWR